MCFISHVLSRKQFVLQTSCVISQKSIFLNALAGAHFFSNLIFLLSFSPLSLKKRELRGEGEGGKEERGKRRVFSNKNISLFGGQKEDFIEIYIISLWGFSFLIYQQTNGKGGCKFFIYTKKTWNRTKLLQKGKVTFDERRRRGLFFKMKERERNYIYKYIVSFSYPKKKRLSLFFREEK